MIFLPDQVYFEPTSREYPLGQKLLKYFNSLNIPVYDLKEYNKLQINSKNPSEFYSYAKRTIVVGIKRSMKLSPCKPSADYEFPLVTGCPGSCQYCYLQTNQALKPYVRIYANVDEILANLKKYIELNIPNITTFEAASTSDPMAVEPLTDSVKRTIEFFAKENFGRLRLVTKFANVDNILDLNHSNHTKIRFSINSKYVIDNFEFNTDKLAERIAAAGKVYRAGYPLGFIIAPIMYYEGWQREYEELLTNLRDNITDPSNAEITFELIQYRFTAKAKNVILDRFPNTKLDMNEEGRLKKWGPYGVYKYVYSKEKSEEIKIFLIDAIKKLFPKSNIEYFT